GELLSVDGTASLAAPGRTITQWNWMQQGHGLVMTATGLVELEVPTQSATVLHLQVVDDLGCPSSFTAGVPVLIGSTPVFRTGSIPNVACVGSVIPLDTDPVQAPQLIQGNGCTSFGSPIFLPDDVGLTLTNQISINNGVPGAIIADPTQIGSLCVEMEHSYMGDLLISLTCPNGSTTVLHQQGGAGTYLGSPIDQDSNQSSAMGTCWSYCWSDTATIGTWADNSNTGSQNTTLAGVPLSSSLNPGTYEPVQPLANLVGCPVNGTWTLSITDLLGSDNGFLCNWCIGMNGEVDSSFVDLGPVLGLNSPDSSYWSGPGVENSAGDHTAATAMVNTPGTALYTYTILDSYGCAHDTTITLAISEVPVLDAGPDLFYCADPVLIDAQVQNVPIVPNCTWTLILLESASDGWNGGAHLDVTTGGSTVTYTVLMGTPMEVIPLEVLTGSSIELFYTAGTIWNNENGVILLNASGDTLVNVQGGLTGVLYSDIIDCGGIGEGVWSPTTGLSDPFSITPYAAPAVTTEYTLTVSIPGVAGCSGSDAVIVSTEGGPPFTLDHDEDTDEICADGLGFSAYDWYRNGAFFEQTSGPCLVTTELGAWTALGIDQQGCSAFSDTLLICPMVAVVQNSGLLVTQTGFASYAWTWNGQPVEGAVGPLLEISGNGWYTVTITTTYGCTVSASIEATGLVGVDESAYTELQFTVFPVPNDGNFTVSILNASGASGNIRILDMTGRVVHELGLGAIPEKALIPMDVSVAPGAYFVRLQLGERILVQRVVIR
ncbi:MAG: proprotein convertase P-domain-containing protein, partial [Flavobacteriales bacterium]|nr:proprotein convertase P-domain-containing protein [Flavobacteriales bacterium]